MTASPLADLELAVASSRADRAADAVLAARAAKVPAREILRAAARASATRYDPAVHLPLHGLAVLGAADRVAPLTEAPVSLLPVLQAVVLAATERKLASPAPRPAALTGSILYLGPSALRAVRTGDLAEAESFFLAAVGEGRERRQAGDWLFRAALEDAGDGGHKLLGAVNVWQLARALGFREAGTILRPAVQYLAAADRNPGPHEAMMAVLGRSRADLESLEAGSKALDEGARSRLAMALAATSEGACVGDVLALLRDGYAAGALADGIALEAARRTLGSEGYNLEGGHALLYADAARHVLAFSRTAERIYALFQSALRVRSPAPHLLAVSVSEAGDAAAALGSVADDLGSRRPKEASAGIRAYLAKGHPVRPLVAILAHQASLDSSVANGGHNLVLTDAATCVYDATRAPEALMALGKMIAASPRDQAASKAWAASLGL